VSLWSRSGRGPGGRLPQVATGALHLATLQPQHYQVEQFTGDHVVALQPEMTHDPTDPAWLHARQKTRAIDYMPLIDQLVGDLLFGGIRFADQLREHQSLPV